MTPRLGHALVCPPGASFADGLTTVALGAPDLARAREQHARYCAALAELGLALVELAPDGRFPDSTFVEDTAVLVPGLAVITRPGAASRLGETEAVEAALHALFARTERIRAPGTLDGGDVCEAGGHVFIGLSQRTNEHGARQLAALLAQQGLTSTLVDIRAVPGILHLKSGLAHPGKRDLLVIDALAAPRVRGLEPPARAARGGVRRQLRARQRARARPGRLRARRRTPRARRPRPARARHVRVPEAGRRPVVPVAALVT